MDEGKIVLACPGAGGLQLIEYRTAIEECFEPGKELLTFSTFDELLAHIETASREPAAMTAIRAAGAQRALAQHTYRHRLETILAAARDGTMTLGADLFALLFATADALEEAGMRLREQQDLSDSPLAFVSDGRETALPGVAGFIHDSIVTQMWRRKPLGVSRG